MQALDSAEEPGLAKAEGPALALADMSPLFLTLSSSLALWLSLQLSLSVAQIMQGWRQRSRVRRCFSLRLVSSSFVPLPFFSGAGAALRSLSFLPLRCCPSVPLVLGAMRSRQAGAALWYGRRLGLVRCFQARRSRLYGLYSLHNFAVWFLYSLTIGKL